MLEDDEGENGEEAKRMGALCDGGARRERTLRPRTCTGAFERCIFIASIAPSGNAWGGTILAAAAAE